MEDGGHSASDTNQDWDWELLADNHHNPNPNPTSIPNSDEDELEVEELEGEASFTDSDVICPNYFSIDNDQPRLLHQNPVSESEMDSPINSDDSNQDLIEPQFGSGSWMDPGQFTSTGRVGKRRRNYSSSSSEASDSSSLAPRNHLLALQPHSDCTHHSSSLAHFPNYDYKGEHFDPLSKCHLVSAPPPPQLLLGDDSSTHGSGNESEKEGEVGEVESPHGFVQNDSSGDISGEKVEDDGNLNLGVQAQEAELVEEKGIKSEIEGENDKGSVAWWRVPLEVLKFCALRVSPVWSLSVAAAAIMGFVLYRRRWLSKMKRKSQGLQLNITVDDKKVSQFMSRAARLNEAFSVVKRVPVIRPSLPAPGLAPWPVMSLR